MALHESFWGATAAAAPVIALAAIVALPDTGRLVNDAVTSIIDLPTRTFTRIALQSMLIRAATFANLIAQATLLALSLAALAYNQDPVPPLVAILLGVGGILLLAWTTTGAARIRAIAIQFKNHADNPPGRKT